MKLAANALQEAAEKMHPRCLRLGLIEAYSDGKVWLDQPRGIRGVYASASLKPAMFATRMRSSAAHPRCLRLGLIEAQWQAENWRCAAKHPRCLRLGLIEAS